jgi:hypothetical protein
MILPPIPNWNKATDDIDSKDVVRRAQDYERSLLPKDIVFPRTGQIWEAVRDCQVNFYVWSPKILIPGGGRTQLAQGELVCIITLDAPKPLLIRFQPVRYDELHDSIVPADIRRQPGYSHYVLCLRIARTSCCAQDEPGYFNEVFRLVTDAPA